MIKRRNIEIAVLLGLCFAIVLSFADFDSRCEELRDGVLRLHILANSDSEADQSLKLKVRDAVLNETKADFMDCENIDDAIFVAGSNTDKICEIANRVIKENGFFYKCTASVKKEYFSTRVYDDFTLPAGNYNSLTLRLGEAAGHNWWCVIFPGVCIPAARDGQTLENGVSEDSAELCYNSQNYVISFKTAEIYEEIKEKLKNFGKI